MITADIRETELTHTDSVVRAAAVKRGGMTPEQHERALTDPDWRVRCAAVELGGLTPEQYERTLTDKDIDVRYVAVGLGGLTPEQHERALTDTSPFVRGAAVMLGGLTPEQRARARKDTHTDVHLAAMYESEFGGVPVVANIDKAIMDSVEQFGLNMESWHCGTTHCRAGWAIHLAGKAGYALEELIGPELAGRAIYRKSRPGMPAPNFFAPHDAVMQDLRRCAMNENN